MSHTLGRVIVDGTRIGPDSGAPATSPGVWEFPFTPGPAAMGGTPRFVILHFTAMSLPGASRLEVDLGYDTDVFTNASGADAWTRPIDPAPGPITVRYIGPGPTGGVTLAEYGSGEPTQTNEPGDYDFSITNPDLFLHTDPYTEPTYQPWLQCGQVINWSNVDCAPAASVQEAVARAVCILVAVHREDDGTPILSSCSGTLIDSDLVLTARHCFTEPDELDIQSGSVCFNYQTACDGSQPVDYAPTFHKILSVRAAGAAPSTSTPPSDWLVLQIDTPAGGLGIVPRELNPMDPMQNDSVFSVHHPNGAIKKFQMGTIVSSPAFPKVSNFDYAGGSSGSALFDSAGQVVGGALSRAPRGSFNCTVTYTSSRNVLDGLANPPAPPTPLDVMLVIDRSGSMSRPGTSGPGRTKIDEARDAASCFVQLVRTGGGDRLGMVSFSSSATDPADTAPDLVDVGQKAQLVGPAPFNGGTVGGLIASGTTSIGDGMSEALQALAPLSGNQRVLLLLTDGLQNTPPMIQDIEGTLGDTQLCIIGFGTEAELDGPLLTRLARDHGGIYTRANDGLELVKFFALCFGNIFESGMLSDPELRLEEGEDNAKAMPFEVCGEDTITVVLGWDTPNTSLAATLVTPGGATVTPATAGTVSDNGVIWWFLRVPLPVSGERDGTWEVRVSRVIGDPEFTPRDEVRYFVSVIARGGPTLVPLPPTSRIYTGDPITPQVALHFSNGTAPHATVEVTIDAPDGSLGKMVAEAGLSPPLIDGDPVDSFTATLQKIADQAGGLPLERSMKTVELLDDGGHDDGGMERDGIYGNPLENLTRYEGTYTFHAKARYGDACQVTREVMWSLHVEVGIDPGRTEVEVLDVADGPDGQKTGVIRVCFRDLYSSPLGPGRGDRFELTGQPGTTLTGPVIDRGDGCYDATVTWDPSVSRNPGLIVGQPGRPPTTLAPPTTEKAPCCPIWLCWGLAIALVVMLIIFFLMVIS